MTLTNDLNWNVTTKHLAKSATRPLGLLIAKSMFAGWFKNNIFAKLFEVLVRSVFEYGGEIWGHGSYSAINSVFM